MIVLKPTAHRLFKATTNSDTCEGRGSEVLIGYFLSRQDAILAAKRKGVMGQDAEVQELTPDKFPNIVVFESYDDYNSHQVDKIRTAALNKLSREEKQALGLM